MANDEIKLDYNLAEAMALELRRSAEAFEGALREIQAIASLLEGGALIGSGGESFVAALRQGTCPSISRFIDKLQELEMDVHASISTMREADARASNLL